MKKHPNGPRLMTKNELRADRNKLFDENERLRKVITSMQGDYVELRAIEKRLTRENAELLDRCSPATGKCATCGEQLDDSYYDDVPGIGDQCHRCHAVEFASEFDGSDGDVVLTSNITLTRDMHYNNLDMTGFAIDLNGYRIFVKGKTVYHRGTDPTEES